MNAREKGERVYGFKVRGLSFGEIQKVLVFPKGHPKEGRPVFASRSGVKKAYDGELARLQREDLDWRRLNVDRTERIISDLMPKSSDPKTAAVIDRLIRTQAVLTGAAKGAVDGDLPVGGINAPGAGGTRALPQNTYANWATSRDVSDAADIIEAEYEELGEEAD